MKSMGKARPCLESNHGHNKQLNVSVLFRRNLQEDHPYFALHKRVEVHPDNIFAGSHNSKHK